MARRAALLAARVVGLPALIGLASGAAACPVDNSPRDAGALLILQADGSEPRVLGAAALSGSSAVALSQRLSVSGATGSGSERVVTYSGTLLRDLLLGAGIGGPADRTSRRMLIEAVASDGYRAFFTWGELFNTSVGDQVIVITARDGRALDAAAGPVALRSLGDYSPGPRHVRNLCAVIVRRL
jgi:hypothetical protein